MKTATREYRIEMPRLKAFWEFEVRDREGRLVSRRKERAHSWVRNFYNLIFCQAAACAHDSAYGLHMVLTNGSTRSSNLNMPVSGIEFEPGDGYWALAGLDTYGIVVGTGVDAFSFEDYALATQIMNGTGSGQLSYIAAETPTISTVGATKKIQHVRYFNNNSGAAITVNEVGLYDYMCYTFSDNDVTPMGMVMTCRDVLGTGVEVPDTGQLKVTYTIQLEYPS